MLSKYSNLLHKEWFKSCMAVVILGGSLFFAFSPLFFGGKVINEEDVAYYYLPAFSSYSAALKNDASIAITPGVFSGFPLALSQVGGFYDPLNALLFAHLHWLDAYNARIFINYFLAGIFMYWLSRSLGASFLASVIAMFAFITAQHIIPGANILRSNSFFLMPGLFLALHRLWTTSAHRLLPVVCWWALGVIVVVCSMLGGYTQLNLYGLISALLFGVFLAYKSFSWRFVAWTAALFAIAIAILAPYVLSSIVLVPFSHRAGGLDWLSASATANLIAYFINLTANLFVPPWHMGTLQSLYIGSISVLFFFASFFAIRKNSMLAFFWGLFAFSVLSAFPYPFFWLMHQLPVFDLFRFPAHWFFVSSFAMSLLAGIGFDKTLALSTRVAQILNKILHSPIGAVAVIGLLVLNVVVPARLAIMNNSIAVERLTNDPWVVGEIKTVQQSSSDSSAPFRTFQFSPDDVNWFLFAKLHPNLTLEQKADFQREYVQTHLSPLLWGLETIRGFDNLEPRRYARVIDFFDLDGKINNYLTPDKHLFSLLGMMNVKYIWTPFLLGPSYPLELLGSERFNFDISGFDFPIYLYENELFLSRAYVPRSVTVMPVDEDNFSDIITMPNDFAAHSFIECNDCSSGTAEQTGSMELGDVSFTSDSVSFRTNGTNDQWAIISNSLLPGWHAYIDGVETQLHYANYIYQGILIPKGTHKVVIRYIPPYKSLFDL